MHGPCAINPLGGMWITPPSLIAPASIPLSTSDMMGSVAELGIKEMREAAGMTQQQLADATGIAQPNLAAYENGRRPVTARVRQRITDATAQRPADRVARHRERVLELVAEAGGKGVHVFGSVARGADTLASDVDLVADFAPGTNLIQVAALRRQLTELLGCARTSPTW